MIRLAMSNCIEALSRSLAQP